MCFFSESNVAMIFVYCLFFLVTSGDQPTPAQSPAPSPACGRHDACSHDDHICGHDDHICGSDPAPAPAPAPTDRK